MMRIDDRGEWTGTTNQPDENVQIPDTPRVEYWNRKNVPSKDLFWLIHSFRKEPVYKLKPWIQLDKIDWKRLSANHKAIHLLEANPDKINWKWLSRNPAAIHLLEANLDKVNWMWLSLNSAAIHLLEANLDKVNWMWLSRNPAIFEVDVEATRQRSDRSTTNCSCDSKNLIKKRR